MMRIAVVDDEPLARSGVVTRLAGHDDLELVGEFGDGASALAGIRAQQPDVIFLDVQMPDMSGIDVLAALAPDERPMAILLTAHDHFAVRAFELNAIDYLLKPIDDERFAEALDRARAALPYRRRDAADVPAAPKAWLTRFEVRVDRIADLQPLSNRDALLRLRDGTPVRASRTYIEPLLKALRGLAP